MSKVKHLQKKARMELHRAHKLRDVCSEFFEHELAVSKTARQ